MLPGRQDDLVRAVAAANPRTVVVVNAGAPVLLPWRDEVGAIAAVWFPGQEFGTALADVLSGDAEPGGRLPVTWPNTEEELPVFNVLPHEGRLDYAEGIEIGYRAWLRHGATPAYPFGHGLGYTQWQLEAIECPGQIAVGEQIPVVVQARNIGARQGKAVVQLYLERVTPSLVQRPVRWLAGFGTLVAESACSDSVTMWVPWRRFAHWDAEWQVEPGEYLLRAGFSVADLDGPAATIRVV
jgi:beta-glucosidase